MLEPRWYQQKAVTVTVDFLRNNYLKNPLIVLPTGSGKSLVLTLIAKHLYQQKHRVLVLSHVEEILSQNLSALENAAFCDVGMYSAGLNRRERTPVTVAGIQSVYKKASLFQRYKYVIVDEAHTINSANEGMYRNFFEEIGEVTVLGLTATPYRTGSGYLTDGNNSLFDKIIIDIPVARLIKEGFLCPLTTKGSKNELDTRGIKEVAGGFSKKQLSEAFDKDTITEKIINELYTYKSIRKYWLLFAIDIAHAEHVCFLLNEIGISSGVIHSKQKVSRKGTIQLFKNGTLQALVSVGTLTTGFDFPKIDLIGLIRPTDSPGLHVQMIGRGLRIHKDKKDCLILDFSGNINRLGPINNVVIRKKGEKKGSFGPSIKQCWECDTHVPAQASACYMCGYIFPLPVPKITENSSNLQAVLEEKASLPQNSDGWYAVENTVYSLYSGNRRTNLKKYTCLKVEYLLSCNSKVVEFINPIGTTKAAHNARHWWRYRTDVPLPPTFEGILTLALRNTLKTPKTAKVTFSGKYPKLQNLTF